MAHSPGRSNYGAVGGGSQALGENRPDALANLRDSLRGMNDAEAAVVVMAAAAHHSLADSQADEDALSTPGAPPRTPHERALAAEGADLREEIAERWAHSSRHRIVIRLSAFALLVAWTAMVIVLGLLIYALSSPDRRAATGIDEVKAYVLCIGAVFVGVSIPLTL